MKRFDDSMRSYSAAAVGTEKRRDLLGYPSPDGKHLATMQMEGESNAWLLENF
jgi:hypothetical protein